jgi:hypothetical protein
MIRHLSLIAMILALWAHPAAAQIQTRGPEIFPGPNEISGHLGASAGYSATTPGGFKLQFDYSRMGRQSRIASAWFNIGFSNAFGSSRCVVVGSSCRFNYINSGITIEPFVGVKIKFQTGIPLVPYVKIAGTFIGIVNRPCGDDGFAFGLRSGGGVKYFLTRHIGLGVEFTWVIGPGFYGGLDEAPCSLGPQPTRAELYLGVDYLIGIEYVF